jgi:hypothetical protein
MRMPAGSGFGVFTLALPACGPAGWSVGAALARLVGIVMAAGPA